METNLDGVYYAIFEQNGQKWRMGSINPNWKQILAATSSRPSTFERANLGKQGIWLGEKPDSRPAAIMCCGLGADWPGMGFELYSDFPAARQAMNRIAGLADWDILGLLKEKNPERIARTRLQIPYLFLLEYAQWSCLAAIGFKPSLISGHSIGELVGLCLAGVYSPESAWQLFDVRAGHMAALEEKSGRQTGMLGISATREQVDETLGAWPALKISNINTPTQFVLSGPRSDLLAARKHLRKQRIPAFMLNVGLAFHNPQMKIMRDLSYRMLNALEMRPPHIPVLSCVTSGLYPVKRAQICRYITDLDEKTVMWTESVASMKSRFNIECFIELGPQEILCGLVEENAPGNMCMGAARKGGEAIAMRTLCARLFAEGHLDIEKILEQSKDRTTAQVIIAGEKQEDRQDFLTISDDTRKVLEILAEVSGRNVDSIRLDMDLRYDLALRSSSFPLLLQEAEKRLKRQITLENLVRVATVGDLARLFCGTSEIVDEEAVKENSQFYSWPALVRFISDGKGYDLHGQINPDASGNILKKNDTVLVCILDNEIFPDILSGMGIFECAFISPAPLLENLGKPVNGGVRLAALKCPDQNAPSGWLDAFKNYIAEKGMPSGFLLVLAEGSERESGGKVFVDKCSKLLENFEGSETPWFIAMKRFASRDDKQAAAWLDWFLHNIKYAGARAIAWLDTRADCIAQTPLAGADMLALEVLYGKEKTVIWKEADENVKYGSRLCPSFRGFRRLFQDYKPAFSEASGLFQGRTQFSSYANPELAAHGAATTITFTDNLSGPWVPPGLIFETLLLGARAAVPWLNPVGAGNISFKFFPVIPKGIARECRVTARPLYWVMQESQPARLCRVKASARELGSNGRHGPEWPDVAEGVISLSLASVKIQPIACFRNHGSNKPLKQNRINEFYDYLEFESPWRLISGLRALEDDSASYECFAGELNFPKCSIADNGIWEYKNISYMLEGIVQGALLAAAMQAFEHNTDMDAQNFSYASWRPAGIGYIRFDPDFFPDGSTTFNLLRTWHTNGLLRFDAQICAADGTPRLAITQLEFEKAVIQSG